MIWVSFKILSNGDFYIQVTFSIYTDGHQNLSLPIFCEVQNNYNFINNHNDNYHLLSDYVPDTLLNSLQVLSWLISIPANRNDPHFIDEETKASESQINLPTATLLSSGRARIWTCCLTLTVKLFTWHKSRVGRLQWERMWRAIIQVWSHGRGEKQMNSAVLI